MTDEAAKTHPEMSLRCAECGHTWKARAALYCLRCGGRELYEQTPWPADAKLPPPAENAA